MQSLDHRSRLIGTVNQNVLRSRLAVDADLPAARDDLAAMEPEAGGAVRSCPGQTFEDRLALLARDPGSLIADAANDAVERELRRRTAAPGGMADGVGQQVGKDELQPSRSPRVRQGDYLGDEPTWRSAAAICTIASSIRARGRRAWRSCMRPP